MVGNSKPNPDGVEGEWSKYATSGTLPSLPATNGYATGKTVMQDGKYKYEIFSTAPYADYCKIDKTKYAIGVDPETDYWSGKNTMAKFIKAAHANGKPAILSIGGWSCSVTLLDAMKKNAENFAKAVVELINKTVSDTCYWGDGDWKKGSIIGQGGQANTFDGVDIDIEPYANQWARMSKDEVKSVVDSIVALRKALDAEFGVGKKSLSFTIGANPNIVKIVKDAGADFWKQIESAVDKVYIMTYDYHGAFDAPSSGTNFHTALYADTNEPKTLGDNRGKFNVDASMQEFSSVLPKHHLLLGAAAYGRAYKMCDKFNDTEFSQYITGKKNFVADFLYKKFINANTGDKLTVIYKANTNIAEVVGNLGYKETIYVNETTHDEVSPEDYAKLPEAGKREDKLDAKAEYKAWAKGYSISEMLKNGDMVEALAYVNKHDNTRKDVIKYKGEVVATFVDNKAQGATYKIKSDDNLIGACGLHKNGYFITYDNPVTVAAKAQYCKENGYGGLIHWEGKEDAAGELVSAAAEILDIN